MPLHLHQPIRGKHIQLLSGASWLNEILAWLPPHMFDRPIRTPQPPVVTNIAMKIMAPRKVPKFSEMFIPDAPCMELLQTFAPFL